MFTALKVKLYAIGAALIGALFAIIKVLNVRNRQMKRERDQAEADLKFRNEVAEEDSEIRQEFSHRADEAKKDIENDEIPEHLR